MGEQAIIESSRVAGTISVGSGHGAPAARELRAPFGLTTVFLCCLGAGAALADGVPKADEQGPAGIAVDEPLLRARAKLIKQGWTPTRRHALDAYAYSGAELELVRRTFFEVEACSSDSSRCILFYSKDGVCLRMDTIGEKLADMAVTRWTDECPDAPPKRGMAHLHQR